MTSNSFKIIGFLKEIFECNERHTKILLEYMQEKEDGKLFHNYIEVNVFDTELVNLIKTLPERALLMIKGEIEPEFIENDDFKYLGCTLVAKKIITKGN